LPVKVDDLHHKELLELDADGGLIRFAGERALLVDAVAMGLLRKYLVENFGELAARTVLTQFGFAHGWRMADALFSNFTWESEEDWRNACTRIHALEGLYRIEPGPKDLLSKDGVMLASSYEAEQHLLHFGRSDVPVCWTICGLASGYLSRTSGREVYVLEDRCMCKGDAACRHFGRTREEWGEDRTEELHFFEPNRLKDCLDVSLNRVTETLKSAERKLRARRRRMQRAAPEVKHADGDVILSPSMRQMMDLAHRVAKVDSTVLISGESGTGKERVARLIHEESSRATGPFIAVNCGAISETLLESELFGHAKGSFTGASHDRPGLFEAANGGTLLLDEIGEVSPGMQVKLLRTLQEREIRRVGENKNRKIDVRVLAATNRDLASNVASGAFRQDLYYRIRVVELHVPPLRLRKDDIVPLAHVLLAEASHRMKRSIVGFAPGVADQLLRYKWPGNIRELENTMERAVVLARGQRVEINDLPEEVRNAVPIPTVEDGIVRPLHEVEREYILAALALEGGNQTRTAKHLEIGAATLYRKLKSYGKADLLAPAEITDTP